MQPARLIAVAVILFGAGPLRAFPEIRSQLKYGPTIATDSSAKVERSGEVRIPFRTIPIGDSSLHFEIVSPPVHGKLSPPKLGDDGQWVALYRHDGDRNASEDGFSFRCQAAGRAKSTVARVRISILKAPPLLMMEPSVIDFGEIFVGERVSRRVTLRNEGGDAAVGKLVTPGGFVAPDGASFRISGGTETVIPLEFAPARAGGCSEKILTEPFLGAGPITLKGTARERFSLRQLSPLRWEVSNECPRVLKLWIENSREWGLPGELTLQRGETKTLVLVPAAMGSDEIRPTQGVRVFDGVTSLEIPAPRLQPPPPIRLEAVDRSPSVKCALGGEASLNFILINPSDFPRSVRWGISSSLGGGTHGDREEHLAPGERKSVRYRWVPTTPDSSVVTVQVTDRLAPTARLSWNARVFKKDPAALNAPVLSSPSIQDPTHDPKDQQQTAPVADPVEIASLSGLRSEMKGLFLGRETLNIGYDRVPGAKFATIEELFPCARSTMTGPGKGNARPDVMVSGPGALLIQGFRTITTLNLETLVLKSPSPGLHTLRVSVWGDDVKHPLSTGVLQAVVPIPHPFWKDWKFWLAALMGAIAIKKIRSRYFS